MEAAPSGGAALYFHGAESVGDGERRWRDHRRIALPGIGDGLGRAILDFSSDYSMVSTPKLWASIVMAAAVGILFFVAVNLAERLALRRYIRQKE